jgi:hypothetical protein
MSVINGQTFETGSAELSVGGKSYPIKSISYAHHEDTEAFRRAVAKNDGAIVLPEGYELTFEEPFRPTEFSVETEIEFHRDGWYRMLGKLLGNGNPSTRDWRATYEALRRRGPSEGEKRRAKQQAQKRARRRQR